jgi:hypothetical protein
MNADTLSAAAGVLLSLVLSYTPGLAPRFDALAPTQKRLALLACLIAVTAASLGIACAPQLRAVWPGLPFECSASSLGSFASAFLAALVSSQAAYTLTPRPAGG